MVERFSANRSTDAALPGKSDMGSRWLEIFTQRTLEEGRVSASTLDAYTLDIVMLLRWADEQKKDLLCLDAGDLGRYVNERLQQGAPPSTVSRHLSSFRRFYAFLITEGALAVNPAAAVLAPRVPRPKAKLLPDKVLEKLLSPRLSREPYSTSAYRAMRDHTIVCMLHGTSLGVSDIRLLRWSQIDERGHEIRVKSRNGKVRNFILDTKLLAELKALRAAASTAGPEQGDNRYCFPTTSGTPMTRQALCQVVRRWSQECGLEAGITPSALRRAGLANKSRLRTTRPEH